MIESVGLRSKCRNIAFGADLGLPSGIVRLLHTLSSEVLLLKEDEERGKRVYCGILRLLWENRTLFSLKAPVRVRSSFLSVDFRQGSKLGNEEGSVTRREVLDYAAEGTS